MIWHFIFLFIYSILITLLLAGKDADSYLLKSKTDNDQSLTRIRRWHRDGAALWITCFTPFLFILSGVLGILCALAIYMLTRAALFDIAFNDFSGLSTTYLGGTASTDKFFIGIFGVNGAVKKSLCFFVLLIAVCIYTFLKVAQ